MIDTSQKDSDMVSSAFSISLYFAPFLIAKYRDFPSPFKILFWNTLLGWTIIGWLILFIYVCFGNPEKARS